MSLLTILLTSIFVFSDPHLLLQSEATGDYSQDQRLIEHSQELFDSIIAVINAENPNIVLLPGDLTNNGEPTAHAYVSAKLLALKNAGKQVYVVPGNHDIHSYFNHDQWLSSYGAFGFQNAVLADSAALNYMVFPTGTNLALIGVNTTEENDSTTHSQGGITREDLSWIASAAQLAQDSNRHPILMVHHPLVTHYTGQATYAPTYLANTDSTLYPALDSVQNVLREAGIMVCFSGHHHIHSIKYATTDNGDFYDITTGSTSSFASQYRLLNYDNATATLSGTTDSIAKYWALEQQRNQAMAEGMLQRYAAIAYAVIDSIKSDATYSQFLSYFNLPNSVEETYAGLKKYALVPCSNVLNDLCRGNEHTYVPEQRINAVHDSITSYATLIFNLDGIGAIPYIGTKAREAAKALMDKLLKEKIFTRIDPILESIEYNKVGTYPVVDDRTFSIILPAIHKTAVAENKAGKMTTKSLQNGHLVIQRGGKLYSVTGAAL